MTDATNPTVPLQDGTIPDTAGAAVDRVPPRTSRWDAAARAREGRSGLPRTDGGDPRRTAARDELVTMHLPLVQFLARRFRDRGEPLEDLVQVGTIGLIRAVDRFDPERGVEFSTYATPTIVGEIKRHFRDRAGRSACRAGCRSCASRSRRRPPSSQKTGPPHDRGARRAPRHHRGRGDRGSRGRAGLLDQQPRRTSATTTRRRCSRTGSATGTSRDDRVPRVAQAAARRTAVARAGSWRPVSSTA